MFRRTRARGLPTPTLANDPPPQIGAWWVGCPSKCGCHGPTVTQYEVYVISSNYCVCMHCAPLNNTRQHVAIHALSHFVHSPSSRNISCSHFYYHPIKLGKFFCECKNIFVHNTKNDVINHEDQMRHFLVLLARKKI